MKYLCMEDIENLAAQGKKELILDEKTVVMDMARDMARQLGIEIIVGSLPILAKPASTAPPSAPAKAASQVPPSISSRDAAPKLANKPKGCQHAPIVISARQEQPNSPQNSDGVLDQLVELVKQSTRKQSGN